MRSGASTSDYTVCNDFALTHSLTVISHIWEVACSISWWRLRKWLCLLAFMITQTMGNVMVTMLKMTSHWRRDQSETKL